jgi:hypothetical protein
MEQGCRSRPPPQNRAGDDGCAFEIGPVQAARNTRGIVSGIVNLNESIASR